MSRVTAAAILETTGICLETGCRSEVKLGRGWIKVRMPANHVLGACLLFAAGTGTGPLCTLSCVPDNALAVQLTLAHWGMGGGGREWYLS